MLTNLGRLDIIKTTKQKSKSFRKRGTDHQRHNYLMIQIKKLNITKNKEFKVQEVAGIRRP